MKTNMEKVHKSSIRQLVCNNTLQPRTSTSQTLHSGLLLLTQELVHHRHSTVVSLWPVRLHSGLLLPTQELVHHRHSTVVSLWPVRLHSGLLLPTQELVHHRHSTVVSLWPAGLHSGLLLSTQVANIIATPHSCGNGTSKELLSQSHTEIANYTRSIKLKGKNCHKNCCSISSTSVFPIATPPVIKPPLKVVSAWTSHSTEIVP